VVFALKAALIPLYLWLPAAYSATSAPVAALFAIMTKVGAYSILRVYTLIFGAEAGPVANLIDPWLLPLALATMAIGTLGVLAARAAPAGRLSGCGVGRLSADRLRLGTEASIGAGLYYLAHTTFAAAAFFPLGRHHRHGARHASGSLDPGPAIANASLVGALFFITAILVSGLPPLSGFMGKYMVLRAAVDLPSMPWVFGVILTAGLFGVIALARSGSLLFYRAEGVIERAGAAGRSASRAELGAPLAGHRPAAALSCTRGLGRALVRLHPCDRRSAPAAETTISRPCWAMVRE
jgi:multicomponent K+:H+ antiporter subunit D